MVRQNFQPGALGGEKLTTQWLHYHSKEVEMDLTHTRADKHCQLSPGLESVWEKKGEANLFLAQDLGRPGCHGERPKPR